MMHLMEANYNYKVLADLEGEYLRDRGMEITEDWLIQYGDDIDVIVAANDGMGMGALNAIPGSRHERYHCLRHRCQR